MSSVRFKLNSNKDIITDIKRFYRGMILESKDNLKGKKDGVEKNHIHAIQFPIKHSRIKDKEKADIYIYTDGSQFIEKETKTKKNRKTGEVIQEEVVKNKLFGYGVFIESKDNDVSTFGIVSNLDSKFYSDNKRLSKMTRNKEYMEQNYCQIIELKAIEEALLNLERYYQNIKERNVFLYSDNLFNVVDLNGMVKYKLIKDEQHPEYKQILGHEHFLRFANKEKYDLLDKIADFIVENKVSISWVRSHQGYRQNELVDRLAKMALSVEKEDFLSGTSRVEDIFANHTYSEVTSKLDKPILQDKLDIKASQRFNNGESKITIEGDNIQFKHNNFTSLQINTNNNHKIIIKSEYEINSNQSKKNYLNLSLKDIEEIFQEKCNSILGRINAANFNSSLDMIYNYCDYQKYKIENFQFNAKSVERNQQAAKEFFNVVDNYFNIKRFKHIDNVEIKYEEPLGKHVVPRNYSYINGDTVYQLSNHNNDVKISAIEEVIKMIDKSKINDLKKNGIKETGDINLVNTSIIQREKFKKNVDRQLSNSLTKEIMGFRKKKVKMS